MYQLTRGQWDTLSPDYKSEHDGRYWFLEVNLETHAAQEVEVEIVEVPAEVPVPAHYQATWPLDPRD